MPSSRHRRRQGVALRRRRPLRINEERSDWAALPTDLIGLVVEKLDSSIDYVRFRSVCSRWRSAVSLLKFPPLRILFNAVKATFSLYDPAYAKIFCFPFPEAAREKAVLGSSHGWLFLIDEYGSISLLNPFTQAQLRLPRATRQLARASGCDVRRDDSGRWLSSTEIKPVRPSKMRDVFICYAILSSSPTTDQEEGCLVAAVVPDSETVAFCRLGEKKWRLLSTGLDKVESIVYHDGRIYAMENHGHSFAIFQVDSRSTRLSLVQTVRLTVRCDVFWLLPSHGEREPLLIASGKDSRESRRRYGIHRCETKKNNKWIWSRVEGVEGKTLFLSKEFNARPLMGKLWGCEDDTIWLLKRHYLHMNIWEIGLSPEERSLEVLGLKDGSSKLVPLNVPGSAPVISTRYDYVSWFTPCLSGLQNNEANGFIFF